MIAIDERYVRISRAIIVGHSPAIPKLLQVGGDGGVQLRGFGLLLAQRRG